MNLIELKHLFPPLSLDIFTRPLAIKGLPRTLNFWISHFMPYVILGYFFRVGIVQHIQRQLRF